MFRIPSFRKIVRKANSGSLTSRPKVGRRRRLGCEPLECRQLLAIDTSVALIEPPDAGVFGEQLSFVAEVTPAETQSGTPTGTATLLDGETTLSTVDVVDGSATFDISSLAVGTHSITVIYSGDETFSTSTSSSAALDVSRASTSAVLVADSVATTYGDLLTFTVTVGVDSPGAGALTGSVTFKDGTTELGTVDLSGEGTAVFTSYTVGAGDHSITATYNGDTNFAESSTDGELAVSVSPATLVVTAIDANRVYGAVDPTFTYTITGFKNNETEAVLAGSPVLTTDADASSSVGSYNVLVDVNSLSSANYTFEAQDGVLTIDQAATASDLTVSPIWVQVGEQVSLTSSVLEVAPGSGTPTGTVTFMDGETVLDTQALPANGLVDLSTSALAGGTHSLTVSYSGDTNFASSTSEVQMLTVSEVADETAPSVTVSAPALTNNSQPTVTISATDEISGVPDGTSVYIDLDLDGDGAFTSEGEAGYATVTLTDGQATFQPTSALADGTYHVRVRASDAAGNQGTSAVSPTIIDTVKPTVTINQASNQTDPFSGSVIYFTVVFSEEVADFTSADIILGGTALPTSVSVSGSGTTYTLSVSGMSGTGTVTATLTAGVATDAAGNTSTASTSTDNQVQYTSTTQSFTLTGPSDNEYQSGDILSIEWAADIASTGSKISLCLDEDTTWDNGNEIWIEIDQVTASNGTGSYAWNTALIEPGTYYVAGYLWNGDNTFTLSHLTEAITISGNWTPQSFTVTSPTSGSYTSGDAATITWTAAGVISGSKISLCLDEDTTWDSGNEHWIKIDQVTAANGSGSLAWNTAAVEPGTYYVAGYMWDGGNTFTLSRLTTSITITGEWTAQEFSLTGPTSGSFTEGDSVTIEWTADGVVEGSLVSLCYDLDAFWDNGNEHWIEIDQEVAANGSHSYSWDTTGLSADTYYVAGYMWDGGTTFTLSHLTSPITITAAETLTVAADLAKPSETTALTREELSTIVAEAKNRLIAALGTQVSNALDQICIHIADLRDGILGQTSGSTVKIDDDGAGYGWFVDSTPVDDSEFGAAGDSYSLVANAGSSAESRVDLLTTVMHEMGHILGYSDESLGDLMDGALPLATRRAELLDRVFATL